MTTVDLDLVDTKKVRVFLDHELEGSMNTEYYGQWTALHKDGTYPLGSIGISQVPDQNKRI